MNAPRKPLRPGDGRPIAENVGRVLKDAFDPPGTTLGEAMVERALRDASSDSDGDRQYVRFADEWRTFIRRQTPDRLDALSELIDEHIERRTMRRFWSRIYKLGLIAVPSGFAAAQFGLDKLPLIKDLIKLAKGG